MLMRDLYVIYAIIYNYHTLKLSLVSAFPNRKMIVNHLGEIAWETEV